MRAPLASAPIHKTYYSSLMIAAQRAAAAAASAPATHLTIEFSCASRRWRAENTLTHCLLVLRLHGVRQVQSAKHKAACMKHPHRTYKRTQKVYTQTQHRSIETTARS